MNDKPAKLMRRVARLLARKAEPPLPEIGYQINRRTGVIRVAPDTVRGVYKQLKRNSKRGTLKV